MKIRNFADYSNIRTIAEAAIGRRGVRAVEALWADAKLGDIDAAARKHRRKAAKVGEAIRASRALHKAVHDAWPAYRAERRRTIYSRRYDAWTAAGVTDLLYLAEINHTQGRGGRVPYRGMPWRAMAPRGTKVLARHLDARRRKEVKRHFEPAYVNGVTCTDWVDSLDACGVEVTSREDWGGYSRSTPYPMTVWTVTVRAMRHCAADLPGGRNIDDCRLADGLITLGAEGIASPDGVTRAWRAVWAVKSRGVSWDIRHGVIVERDGEVVHGATLERAMATLRTRRTVAQRTALARRGIDRATALAVHGERRLSWRVARRAGLCADGISAWVARHFPELHPRRDSITVREALETGDSEALVLRAVALVAKF